jgi:hypothetical protein
MSNFKVGDKVVRIKHFEQGPRFGWPDFVPGEVYTVSDVNYDGSWIGLEERKNYTLRPYVANFFALAPYQPKVGDYVECIEGGYYFTVGAKGVVRELAPDDTTRVFFTSGDYDVTTNAELGGLWVTISKLKLAEPHYSSSFTKSAKAEPPQGHVADGSGLQKHSIGSSYPWAVVAYGDERYSTKYTIENLHTGAVLSAGSDYPRQWVAPWLANSYLEWFIKNGTVHSTNVGRPVFKKSGALIFQKKEPEQPITVYYRALEQDIG